MRLPFSVGLLVLGLAIGCRAQVPQPAAIDAETNRHIEVLVRTQYNVPEDYTVSVGTRASSQIPGYDTLPITFTRGAKSTAINFLLSSDGKTLARLQTYDLDKEAAFHIDTTGRPIRGNPDAKVTIVNFDDLECPYCAKMHQSLFPSTLDRYKGKVRFVYKDFPLAEVHPWAIHAAVDANCIAAQSSEAYWTYVDYLHAHGQEVTGEDRDLSKSDATLDRIARQQATLGKLDAGKLDACLTKQDDSQVRASMKDGDKLGIDSTPSLFIDGERIVGWLPEDQLWMVIDRALRAAGEEPPAPTAAPAPSGAPKGSGK
ncbi:MAG TPA: thioredoxin domain-containing protein [Terracidiphilus sp.]|nr:thioredoxin domain-containing protein [Terracidiphilus sp.]